MSAKIDDEIEIESSGEDKENGETSWEVNNLEENLERLLEKYAHLTSENEQEPSKKQFDHDDDYGDDTDELVELEDDTDYYSMKIEKRQLPFAISSLVPLNIPEMAEKGVGTTDTSDRDSPPPLMPQRLRRVDELEASLIETGKGLLLNDSAVGSTGSSRVSKADLSKIYSELNDIHQRLVNEYNLFKRKEKNLHRREQRLREFEESVLTSGINQNNKQALSTSPQRSVQFEAIKAKYDQQLDTIRDDVKLKMRENKRLYHAFKSIRESNESLKLRLAESEEKLAKMERQNSALNGRLFSLLKKIENETSSPNVPLVEKVLVEKNTTINDSQTKKNKNSDRTISATAASTIEALSQALEWINEMNLKRNIDFNLMGSNDPKLLDKCQRILPTVSQLLQTMNVTWASAVSNGDELAALSLKKRHTLTCLEFAYWVLLHVDLNASLRQNYKINLSATFRHIGLELYKCLLSFSSASSATRSPTAPTFANNRNGTYQGFRVIKQNGDKHDAPDVDSVMATTTAVKNDTVNLSSALAADALNRNNKSNSTSSSVLASLFENKHARILSCLIMLKTFNQVDVLINVMEQLRDDLNDEESKQTFLDLYGTWAVLKFFRLGNQNLLDKALDIYIQLSVDGKLGEKFIETCGNEYWFSQIALIFRNSSVSASRKVFGHQITTATGNNENFLDLNLLEKLSILLQKLSKSRSNRKFFDMFGLNKICHNLLQRFYTESDFLSMNLKSVISNLSPESAATATSTMVTK